MTTATLQRIQTAIFLSTVFALAPIGFVWLTGRYSGPRWQIPAGQLLGGVLMALSLALYVWCRLLFKHIGKGTTGPIEQTTQLIAVGPYRHTRSPVYLAYLGYFLALFLVLGHSGLLLLAVLAFAVIQTALVLWEERDLTDRFGEPYTDYAKRTPRWLL